MEIKTMDYDITDKHMKLFEATAEDWIDHLGLTDWERAYALEDIGSSLAACSADRDGRLAVLILCSVWHGTEPTDAAVEKAAVHEVLELLLWDLCDVAKIPGVTTTEVNATRHAVIRRLEEVLI